jgi:hypothetical protein
MNKLTTCSVLWRMHTNPRRTSIDKIWATLPFKERGQTEGVKQNHLALICSFLASSCPNLYHFPSICRRQKRRAIPSYPQSFISCIRMYVRLIVHLNRVWKWKVSSAAYCRGDISSSCLVSCPNTCKQVSYHWRFSNSIMFVWFQRQDWFIRCNDLLRKEHHFSWSGHKIIPIQQGNWYMLCYAMCASYAMLRFVL